MSRKKMAASAGAGLALLWELALNTDFIRSHLPRGLIMHSDPWVVALLAAIVLLLVFGDKEPSKEVEPVNISNENKNAGIGSSVATAGNTTVIVQALPSTLSQQPIPPSVSTKGGPKHNVRLVGTQVTRVSPSEGSVDYFLDPPENMPETPTLKAFIAKFRNERIPERKVGDWDYVRAQIIYRGEHEEEITNVGAASWVNSKDDYVHFDDARVRSVIVAIQRGDGTWVGLQPEARKADRRDYIIRELKTVELTKDICEADVILHDSSGESLKPIRVLMNLEIEAFGLI